MMAMNSNPPLLPATVLLTTLSLDVRICQFFSTMASVGCPKAAGIKAARVSINPTLRTRTSLGLGDIDGGNSNKESRLRSCSLEYAETDMVHSSLSEKGVRPT
jgi:hypothetical protein